MIKISSVKVLDGYQLDLLFTDGIRGVVDLTDLVGKGVFNLWSDYEIFSNVKIGEVGELTWGNEIDLCSDSLYMIVTGKNAEDIFPNLKHEPANA